MDRQPYRISSNRSGLPCYPKFIVNPNMLTETITYINSMLPITNGGPSEKNTLAAPEDLAHRGDSRTNEYDEKA